MFAPWRSQKSVRKHKDPITGNSFITRDDKINFATHITIRICVFPKIFRSFHYVINILKLLVSRSALVYDFKVIVGKRI